MYDEASDEVLEQEEIEHASEPAPAEPVEEEPAPESKPARTRKVDLGSLVLVRVYPDGDGYRFVGVDVDGRAVKGSESSHLYSNRQLAKQAAHATHPTLPVR